MTGAIQNQLQLVKNQIIEKYQPEKIVLFGSTVNGNFKEESDFDLLIIKDTADHPVRRVQKLSSLVNRQIPCDFLVFTPQEIAEKQKNNDFFIQNILETGKIIYER